MNGKIFWVDAVAIVLNLIGFAVMDGILFSRDMRQLVDSSVSADVLIGGLLLIGIIGAPVMLLVSYHRKQRNAFLPLLVSLLLSVCAAMLLILRYPFMEIRTFLVSATYLIAYSVSVVLKLRRTHWSGKQ